MSEKAAKKAPAKKTSAKKAVPRKAPMAEEKEGTKKEERKTVEIRPAPMPLVMARHELGSQERQARGYSLGELASAGISFNVAKKIRIPLDLRRRSALESNVSRLKGWYVPAPKKARTEAVEGAEKPAGAPKKGAKAKKTKAS